MITERNFIAGLSVDGDSQGMERLLGALSAHMWPGMVLKSGDTINQPSLPEQEGLHLNLVLLSRGGKMDGLGSG